MDKLEQEIENILYPGHPITATYQRLAIKALVKRKIKELKEKASKEKVEGIVVYSLLNKDFNI